MSIKTLLIQAVVFVFLYSCSNNTPKQDTSTDTVVQLADSVYYDSYTYIAKTQELGTLRFEFTLNEYGAEGKAYADDKRQHFRIEPMIFVGDHMNLKLLKQQTVTNDLAYYDYLFNFEYRYLTEDSILTSFYSNDEAERKEVVLYKID